jgi:hypothetical protein
VLLDLHSAPRRLVAAFAILSLTLISVGLVTYERVGDSIRVQENQRLAIIAKFKAEQVESWLADRRSDTRVHMTNPASLDALKRLSASPDGGSGTHSVACDLA